MMRLNVIKQIRTNNFNDEQLMLKITAMWQEANQKLHRYDQPIYAVYHDYEGDYRGDYSLSVAVENKRIGKSVIKLPQDDNYEVFPVNPPDDKGIVKTWNQIWKLEDTRKLNRKYTYDFELYYPNGDVEIHIALIRQ